MQRAEHGSGSTRSGAPPAAAAAAAAVAMSSDFESYEQDFAVLTADITGRIGKVPKLLGGEPGGERGLGKEPGWQGRAGQGGAGAASRRLPHEAGCGSLCFWPGMEEEGCGGAAAAAPARC